MTRLQAVTKLERANKLINDVFDGYSKNGFGDGQASYYSREQLAKLCDDSRYVLGVIREAR
jgi:hypothetical protein